MNAKMKLKNYLILKISLYLVSINSFCESQHVYNHNSANLTMAKIRSNCDDQINLKTLKRWRFDHVQSVEINSNKSFSNNNFTDDGQTNRKLDLKNVLPYIKNLGSAQDVSKNCLATLNRILSGIANGDEWALGGK